MHNGTEVGEDALIACLGGGRPIRVVDIGASPAAGYTPPYQRLLDRRLCRLVGFEPQAAARAILDAYKSELETYLPHVVGDGKRGRLRVCWGKSMTSLLNPNRRTIQLFEHFEEWCRIEQELEVPTLKLDDIGEIDGIDYLKIDAQGAELSILQNGRRHLQYAVAVQAEVSFVPVYERQPGFGEIDCELRALGFVAHTFASLNKQPIAPLTFDKLPYEKVHQIVEADIVYVRDFTKPEDMDDEQLRQLALIAYLCYDSTDLAMHCVSCLGNRGALPGNAAHNYATNFDLR